MKTYIEIDSDAKFCVGDIVSEKGSICVFTDGDRAKLVGHPRMILRPVVDGKHDPVELSNSRPFS